MRIIQSGMKSKDVGVKLNKVLNKAAIEGKNDINYSEILELNPNNILDYKSMADILSIEKTVSNNARNGNNASFVSTTDRINYKSEVPGPGSYDINHEHKFKKNKFDSFGTTSERNTEFNRNISLPFTDPSFLSNPPVGYYLGKKTEKNSKKTKSISPVVIKFRSK